MKPHYETENATLWLGDCIEVMRLLPECSVDAIVTDPPYGLGFMGKDWDDLPPGLDFAVEALRVLKPGGHLLAFGGTRTWHRLAVAVEDAGFEIRDSIAWLYGSGFPKSLDVAKAIDKASGHIGEVVGERKSGIASSHTTFGDDNWKGMGQKTYEVRELSDAAREGEGWGTALKPAFEPIVVARKPLAKGHTVAANVLAHGTGALNIDATRIAHVTVNGGNLADNPHLRGTKVRGAGVATGFGNGGETVNLTEQIGRWPTNVLLDESQAAALDKQTGTLTSGILAAHHNRNPKRTTGIYGDMDASEGERGYGDSGGASRFFPVFRYEAKAPTKERPTGIDEQGNAVAHPTVKPVDLMRWLCRLVTPPGGTILEPFAGSGTTVEAALTEGFHVIAIEREADYIPLIEERMSRPMNGGLFSEDEL